MVREKNKQLVTVLVALVVAFGAWYAVRGKNLNGNYDSSKFDKPLKPLLKDMKAQAEGGAKGGEVEESN